MSPNAGSGPRPSVLQMEFTERGSIRSDREVWFFAESQRVLPAFRFFPEPLPREFRGHNAGGDGDWLGTAQSRCRFWIPGMLRLLVAIDRATG